MRSQAASHGSWGRARSEIDSRRAETGPSGPKVASRWATTPELTVRETGSPIRLRQAPGRDEVLPDRGQVVLLQGDQGQRHGGGGVPVLGEHVGVVGERHGPDRLPPCPGEPAAQRVGERLVAEHGGPEACGQRGDRLEPGQGAPGPGDVPATQRDDGSGQLDQGLEVGGGGARRVVVGDLERPACLLHEGVGELRVIGPARAGRVDQHQRERERVGRRRPGRGRCAAGTGQLRGAGRRVVGGERERRTDHAGGGTGVLGGHPPGDLDEPLVRADQQAHDEQVLDELAGGVRPEPAGGQLGHRACAGIPWSRSQAAASRCSAAAPSGSS